MTALNFDSHLSSTFTAEITRSPLPLSSYYDIKPAVLLFQSNNALSPLIYCFHFQICCRKQRKVTYLKRRSGYQLIMQPVARRRAITRNGVAAGSVWETRMKMDEVRGGIKVFNASGDGHDDEEGLRVYGKLRQNQRDGIGVEKRQRKSWKQPEPPRSPIQLRKAKSTEIGCKSGVEEKGVLIICDGQGNGEEMEDEDIEIEVEEHRGFDDKEMDLPAEIEKKVEEVKKIEREHEMDVSMQPPPQPPAMVVVEKKTSDFEDFKVKDPDPEPQIKGEEEEEEDDEILYDTISGTSNRMQHIVDLVMWRDIPKTSFAFGFGTFFLLSSSYAKDINFSLISVISYMGLAYLAAVFLLKSILRRTSRGEEAELHESCLIGEEEAIWILRRILPYLNELLLRTRALFSGDPATTMKLAVILFVMARCGNSITLWTLAKLLFFGVFTVPKALSSYSVQLSRYSQFWLARLRDGWDSCAHKKAVAAAVFTLIWNLSSTVARIWAVFMLVIAIRLYQQQCMMMTLDEWEVTIEQHDHLQQQQHGQQKRQSVTTRPCLKARPRKLGRDEKMKKMAV